jgi:23S rRNA pseudouridine1911/1915/1917 synthase
VTVDKPLGRDPNDRTRMTVRIEGGRTARTDLTRLARFESTDLLRAQLHTGRTHQIRVHLTSIGHPVVGDDTYGGGGGRRLLSLPPKRHFLHAAWLVFRHPVEWRGHGSAVPAAGGSPPLVLGCGGEPTWFAHPDPLEYLGFYRGIG